MATTKDYQPNMVLSNQEFKVIGTRPVRHDGYERIAGRARYTSDVQLQGMLHTKVLRSPYPHARIRSIDTRKAEALPGVRAVITAKDFGWTEEQRRDLSGYAPYLNTMAYDKAVYVGHAVAAVAADDPYVAEEAASLIKVDYEVLPYVLTAPEGMKEGAPILHDHVKTKDVGQVTDKVSNVATHLQYKKGDVEKGFKEADFIVEREFNTASVHQGYIEPHASVGFWDVNDRLTLWTSTQGNFTARDFTARVLSVPSSKIKVMPAEIGGGFGGKLPVYLEPIVALLSKKSGRPVKAVMSRKEDLEATGPTSGSYIRVKMGVKKDGRITAAQVYMAYEAGGFPGSPVTTGSICILAPYDLENVLVDGYDVLVNKPKSQAYRAPGTTNAAFALETVVDELAEKISMDPLELRHINGAKEGTERHDGVVYPRVGYLEVLEAAMEHPHYKAPLNGPNSGRGVAAGYWLNFGLPHTCYISVNYDGAVGITTGAVDLAGTRTATAMHVAEVLGIPVEDIRPSVGDTDSLGWSHYSAGSSITFSAGWAGYEAAQDVKRQLMERAANIWDIPVDQVEYEDGVITSKSDPNTKFTFKELAGKLSTTGGPITGRASVTPRGAGGAFGACIVDVEVDPETGKVDILRSTVIQDVGKAIHPSYVEGQMQGGVVQGIGWALNEEYYYNDQGVMTNSSLLDYRMPTSLDLPMIDTVIVEVANPGHPYGARGVGENPIVAPAAAVGNAIYHAIGIRMNKLPMKPGNILEALWANNR